MPRFCHILKGEPTEVADLCGMGCEKSEDYHQAFHMRD